MSSSNGSSTPPPIYDVEEVFPGMLDGSSTRSTANGSDNVAPQVNSALRDALGWRPRVEDPKAFVDALTASFRLVPVEGHVEAQFVPRGYAVQADLGAVTGGQASLYRRATISRTEMLRILDGQVSLRVDSDPEEMAAYRSLVHNAINRLIDELGTAGGPRVQVVDNYFHGLTGCVRSRRYPTADNVGGQLGKFRDKFGLFANRVNTVEEEGIRTSFWTLVDMVVDLQRSWDNSRGEFAGTSKPGFLGTDLIRLSREMEAAADQIDELEAVLDSVLIGQPERRTLVLDTRTRLTLDDLLRWLHSFLSEEGRQIIQDAGRDGIVSAFIPTAIDALATFKCYFANRINGPDMGQDLPQAFRTGRVRIATASATQLLTQLTQTALRVGHRRTPAPMYATFERIPEPAPRGPAQPPTETYVRVSLHGINFGDRQLLAFYVRGESTPTIFAKPNTNTATAEVLGGEFAETDLDRAFKGGAEKYIDKHTPIRDIRIAITKDGKTVYPPRRT